MEWEEKFSSIIRETESNLAKVKQRLGSAHTASVNALSFNGAADLLPERNSFNMSSPLSRSHPLPSYSIQSSGLMSSSHRPLPTSNTSPYSSPSKQNYDGILPIEQSPAVLNLLSDRIESQTRSMEQLTRTVRLLEEEKNTYQAQVRDLKGELSLLNDRMAERGVDIATERKVESWKRDVMAELQLLQSQIQLLRSDDIGSLQTTNLIRELNETKRQIIDECDSIRRELDTVKSRVAKVEVDVSNVITDNRDIGRRHDRLDKSMRDIVDSYNVTARDVSRTMGERGQDKHEIVELKNSLRSIQQKLDDVQNQVEIDLDKQKKRPPRPSFKKSKAHPPRDVMSPTTTDADDVTDSVDLLDLQSLDLSLSPKHNKLKQLGTFSEDDLDVDLTTDDLLSSYSCLDTDDLK